MSTFIVPEFGDPEPCAWCGEDAHGRTVTSTGYWLPSCGYPECSDGGAYRGAR